LQGVGEKHWRTPASVARMVKVHAVPGDPEESVLYVARQRRFMFDDNCFA
jgi:hypothetical protein